MPSNAEMLVGLNVRGGFQSKIKEFFGGTRSCMHLCTLLRSMALAVNQAEVWNHTFPMIEDNVPPERVPEVMEMIREGVNNSCHAWAEDGGKVTEDFAEGRYGPMLQRSTPVLLQKWKLYQESEAGEDK